MTESRMRRALERQRFNIVMDLEQVKHYIAMGEPRKVWYYADRAAMSINRLAIDETDDESKPAGIVTSVIHGSIPTMSLWCDNEVKKRMENYNA